MTNQLSIVFNKNSTLPQGAAMKFFLILTTVLLLSSCRFFTNDPPLAQKALLDSLTKLAAKRISSLPEREGRRPLASTKSKNNDVAHVQVTDCNYPKFRVELIKRILELPYSEEDGLPMSVALRTRVFTLSDKAQKVNPAIFLKRREFVHVHGPRSCSYHMTLRVVDMALLVEKGWAEYYPKRHDIILLYAPRNKEEMETAWFVICKAYFASRSQ
jgi:hypothetical protein